MEDRYLIHLSKTLGAAPISQFDQGGVSSHLNRGFHNSRDEVFSGDILRLDKHSVAGIGENPENERLHNCRKDWGVLGAERHDRS